MGGMGKGEEMSNVVLSSFWMQLVLLLEVSSKRLENFCFKSSNLFQTEKLIQS